jgi:hypothetical protein
VEGVNDLITTGVGEQKSVLAENQKGLNNAKIKRLRRRLVAGFV